MATRITTVGIGGAGTRAIERAAMSLPEGVAAAVLNTDTHELEPCSLEIKLQLGAVRTGGVGCGGDAGVGRLAAEDDIATVRNLLREKDLVIVSAGLGGGTGSGGSPAVLRAAREEGALTVALVSLPFAFEGASRKKVAEEALAAVRDAAHVVIVVPNDRLFESLATEAAAAAFAEADRVLGLAVAIVSNLLVRPGYLSLDFADLKQMVGEGGTCAMGFAEATGDQRAAACVESLMASPLLDGGGLLKRAKAAIVGIIGGTDLSLHEIGQIMDGIGGVLPSSCDMVMGSHLDAIFDGQVAVIVLAAEQWGSQISEGDAAGPADRRTRKSSKRPARRKSGAQQTTLGLDLDRRGRFKNVEPTILDGENLDVPTFMRRGIELGK